MSVVPGASPRTTPVSATRRPVAWLLALALCAFALQTDDFVIVGVLPALARGLAVGEAAAGQLVTVFSVICAVAAPVAAVATARVPRRRLLTAALAVFCLANAAVPLAGSYGQLMALRVLAALAAATALPATLALTAQLAPAERQGRSLATVMAGLTCAVVIGVPAGTWIGAAFGWRATFLLGAALGLAGLVCVRASVPDVPPAPAPGLAARLRPLSRPAVLCALLAAALAVLGNLLLQTYLAPFLRGAAGITPSGLGLLLVVTGIAGIAGARAGGTLVDRWGPRTAFAAACAVFAAAMAGLVLAWSLRPAQLGVVVPLLILWSAAAWSVPPAVQARVLTLAGPRHGPQALALSSSAVYVGASLGGGIGGRVLATRGAGALPVAAGCCALLAVAVFLAAGAGKGGQEPEGGGELAA
ncbi:MFS transporter [Streptomyces pinistramenti]|uniref:MFS transporter n=1 Tax=Streptomyces pinistramenti TaxID=2884812 RepID=UPI001D083B9A|nr:MFS transporter [Streptomyces pinistramenti]MCB5909841.1 MFS transporter [Streptomyces pinistramenti]